MTDQLIYGLLLSENHFQTALTMLLPVLWGERRANSYNSKKN